MNENRYDPKAFSDLDAADPGATVAFLDEITAAIGEGKHAALSRLKLLPGARVLDVGCGTGADLRLLAEAVGPSGCVEGVDISETMIAECLQRGIPPNVRVQVAGADALPFDANTFDAARSERVIQHLANPRSAVRELFRVLKPGGMVLIIDQDWDTVVVSGSERELTRTIVHAHTDRMANGWAGRQQRPLLEKAGFIDVAATGVAVDLPYRIAMPLLLLPALRAARNGGLSEPDGRRFLTDLETARDHGVFACAFTMFSATAKKP